MGISIVDVIQAMLAPGIMISACGLLLLGMNNKYSLVVNRIRLLDEEKRGLKSFEKQSDINKDKQKRLKSILVQIEKLHDRVKFVRNAVFSYSVAVALFILSSLFIGLNLAGNYYSFKILAVLFFLLGMILVFIGILYAALEVWKGYRIVQIEIMES